MVVLAGIMISGSTCTPDCCVPGTSVISADQTALVFEYDGTPVTTNEVIITVAHPSITWKASAPTGWAVMVTTGKVSIAPAAINTDVADKTGIITIQSVNGDILTVKVTQKGAPSITITTQLEFDDALAALAPYSVLNLLGTMTFMLGTGIELNVDVTINGNGATLEAVNPISRGLSLVSPFTAYAPGDNPAILITGGAVVKLNDLTITTKNSTGVPYAKTDGITIMSGELELDQVTFDGIYNQIGVTGIEENGRCITAYGTSKVTVTNSVFKNFNKNGIHMFQSSQVDVSDSSFEGVGTLGIRGQNGIVFNIGFGGQAPSGTITDCDFDGFVFDSVGDDACAVLIFRELVTDVYTQIVDGLGNTYGTNDQDWYVYP